MTLKALSLTAHVNDWLANTHHPRMLHVFDNACNLFNEHGGVLSVVTAQIGNGPFNIVLGEDIVFSSHLDIESSIFILEGRLRVGSMTINLENAKLWNPKPNWEILYNQKEKILTRLLQLPITNYPSPIPQFSKSLITALAIADIPASLTAAKKLAGLGIGLTPSGDDFITGALYAAWIIHPFEVVSHLAGEITETTALLTTSLSAAWLKSAGKGEAGVLWHKFFDALISDGDLQLPIAALLAVGETSGADALAGFLGVCSFYERIIDECPS